jgi:ferric-dicitrate binding protein FerR (iron transport regulator)
MMQKDIPWIAIQKFFEEKASNDENLELLHWLDANFENKVILKQLHSYWKKKGSLPSDFSPETKKALHQVRKKIDDKKGRPLGYYFIRFAAVFVIAIVGFGIYKTWLVKQQNTLVSLNSNNDIKNECVLNDGSKIWLNRNSQIQYPKKFKKGSRTIQLKGEAYFEVASKKNKPFIVDIGNSKITVLGTKFNIDASGPKTIVSVSEGKVAFTSAASDSVQLILTQNEEGVFDIEKGGMLQKSIDVNFLSWKTHEYIFKSEPLYRILDALATDYMFTYEIKSSTIREELVTANFSKLPIHDILESIALSLDVDVQYEDNHLTIK